MKFISLQSLVISGAAALLLAAEQGDSKPTGKYPFVFRDAGEEAGLFPHLTAIRGHAAGWGDVDGDGWLDLYVGTFFEGAGKPNLFLRNSKGKFQLDGQEQLRVRGRASAALFADLDNDGDLDLYVSNMPQPAKGLAPCSLFRNDGNGKFTDISKDNGACPAEFGGRSATVLDFDGDGLLDLLVGEDPIAGYNGSKTTSSRLFRNKGSLQFEDVSQAVGLPKDIPGLGVAAGDVNGDGWPDFFLAARGAGNRLFLNDGKGKFAEAPGTRKVFDWSATQPKPKGDDTSCGVCFGDVNRDGRPDIVIGHHYQRPWLEPVFNRLYLNRGVKDGQLVFEEITEAAAFQRLPMKAPHVEIQDFDNDGWPDIYASMVKFAGGTPCPLIWKNLGVKDGLPRFREDALAVNDFPTAQDKAVTKSGTLFDKAIKEKKVIYMAPGPSGDYDNDGRLDLFLPNWWVESPSLLLRNETPGGNWLKVEVVGGAGVNRMGIGSAVRVYPAGKAGEAAGLLGCKEISTGYGYTSGQEAVAHFGLGKEESVDIEVTLPHGKGKLVQKGVKANQRVTVKP
jgi:hypothetical protein